MSFHSTHSESAMPKVSTTRPGSPLVEPARNKSRVRYGRACLPCRRRKTGCRGEGDVCTPCEEGRIECIRGTAKRPILRQYVDSLEKYIKALESGAESRRAYCQEVHDNSGSPHLHSHHVLSTPVQPGCHPSRAYEELPIEASYDLDDDADIEQIIAPMKRLVLVDGDLSYYGSFSPFAHDFVPKRVSPFPQVDENCCSRYVLMVDGADGTHINPNFNWSRHLPREVRLSRREHDRLLDLLFKFVAAWCLRIVPSLFLRDMVRALSVPPSQPPPRLSHYSPMLHNALLALAMAFSHDPQVRDLRSRQFFANKAKSYLEAECQSPNISVVHALSILATFHSSLGEQTLGYMYFGMSGRIGQVLGLSIDSSPLVTSSQITHHDMLDRNWAYWTTFSQDVCWSLYVGRDFSVMSPSDQHPIPVPFVDPEFDQIPWHYPPSRVVPQPGFLSTTFANSCELLSIAKWIMDVVSRFRKRQEVNHTIIGKIDVELNAWKGRLPAEVNITSSTQATALPHHLMLQLAYWWLFILLHRPFYRRSRNSPPSEKLIDHVELCNAAAKNILQLLGTWRSLYTLRYVPIMWIQIVYSAGTIFLLSASQAGSDPQFAMPSRSHSLSQVDLCIQYLFEAGESWQAARHVKQILERLHKQLATRMEAQPIKSGDNRNGKRESSSDSRLPSWFSEWPSVPAADTPTFPMQECYEPSLPSDQYMSTSQQPSPNPQNGFGNLYGGGQFQPVFDGDGSFAVTTFFGFPGIPANRSPTPQPFLTFGDPGLTGFGPTDLQQHSATSQNVRSEPVASEYMDAFDQFLLDAGFQ